MKNMIAIMSLLIAGQSFAKIEELSSYTDFDLNHIDENTLVIFDIDNTLIRQDQMIGTHQWGDYMRERAIKNGMPEAQAKTYQHQVFAELQRYLNVTAVEPNVLKLLRHLEKNQVPHFALTARPSSIMDVTLQQIRILHHDFAKSFPEQIQPDLLKEYLRSGVIFSGDTPKGELLKTIIANSKVKPTKIIFFDDRRYNLESIETSFANSPIELLNLRYGAADPFMKAFDAHVADLQYSFFKEYRWVMGDYEAFETVGDLNRILKTRFEKYMEDQGPLPTNARGCVEVSKADSSTPVFECKFDYDDRPMVVQFQFKIAEDGGISFGTW